MEPIRFNSKTPQWSWLSNFWPCPIQDMHGRIWKSAEHLYQAGKSDEPQYLRQIFQVATAWEAKSLGRQAAIRPGWDQKRVPWMRRLLIWKFSQNPELRERLLATGSRPLLHLAPWDTFWGVDREDRGQNMQGKLLMELRSAWQAAAGYTDEQFQADMQRFAAQACAQLNENVRARHVAGGYGTRVVNKRQDAYDVYIGRPSPWGNPFSHLSNVPGTIQVNSREEAVSRYRSWLAERPELVERARQELRGKVLGCFCKPQSCHGDILVQVAESNDDRWKDEGSR